MEAESHKPHRSRKAGRKAERKKVGKALGGDADAEAAKPPRPTLRRQDEAAGSDAAARIRNPKAFAFNSAVKANKLVRRAADLTEKKKHVVEMDRTPAEPPPVIVAIVGPPKVGKTTVLRGLIRSLTRQKLAQIQGPVSLVTGKKRRMTLLECPNDLNAMIDVAKVADLVLLLVDASFGLEMETFEFLNICQVHGMPRVIGVLTHLDLLKTPARVKSVKKTLKHRFWTEVYQGAKLFYLSGMVGDTYLTNEVKNLARFITVMKYRPIGWRTSHPYLLADRMEDLTEAEVLRADPAADRRLCLYGYVRGTHFRHRADCHIPGMGDVRVSAMTALPDPCPLPEQLKKRSLDARERVVYAPLSGLSGILYDADAVYVEERKRRKKTDKKEAALLGELAEAEGTLDEGVQDARLELFKGAAPIDGAQDGRLRFAAPDGDSSDDDAMISDQEGKEEEDMDDDEASDRDMELDEDAKREFLDAVKEEGEGEEEKAEPWAGLSGKANSLFATRPAARVHWPKLVYGDEDKEEESRDSEGGAVLGGLFRLGKGAAVAEEDKALWDRRDSCTFLPAKATTASASQAGLSWAEAATRDLVRDAFVGKDWVDEDGDDDEDPFGEGDGEEGASDSGEDSDVYGDFEDLETKETFKAAGKKAKESEEDGEEDEEKPEEPKLGEQTQEKDGGREKREVARLAKKRKLKQMFDAEYDETSKHYHDLRSEMDAQALINREEFQGLDDEARVELEGFRPGMYVRVELDGVSPEFVQNFDPAYPVLLGGLLAGEQNVGCVQVRLKKHRWYPRILKTRDPVTFSLGWRRFQTMPIYTNQDHNGRHRMLKYTPEHMHCSAAFWGPLTPQNTGLLAFQTLQAGHKGFRVAATGVVLNLDRSLAIMKKLKLTGTPYKVFKKSAFVKGMFNSSLEVAKFQGAALRTVAGLRGQIKRAVGDTPGAFRATFEDKILLRDIVFLRTWYQVEVPSFYAVVDNLMLEASKRGAWEGMRTVGQLRHERSLPTPQQTDSLYRPIVRRPFVPDELVVPGALQKTLPYALKPKTERRLEGPAKGPRGKLETKHTAVVLEPHQSKMNDLMKMLRAVKDDRVQEEKERTHQRVSKHKEKLAALEARKADRMKGLKKRVCRAKSKHTAKGQGSSQSRP